ncbi:MAG: hypothetical protein WA919_26855 [Coleofasciculaceae cyanobacterium]
MTFTSCFFLETTALLQSDWLDTTQLAAFATPVASSRGTRPTYWKPTFLATGQSELCSYDDFSPVLA